MPDEEKELTIEEMRALVSLSTLLPALTQKIAAINKKVDSLDEKMIKILKAYEENTKAVNKWQGSVNTLLDNQVDSREIQKELKGIKESIDAIKVLIDFKEGGLEKPLAPKATKKPVNVKKEEKDPDEEKVISIVDKILATSGGRKTRLLTLINIKKGFDCDDELAEKVLAWLENKGMYNPKTKTLTFPKK